MGWFTIAKEILGLGGSLIGGWVEHKKLKTETKVELQKARAKAQIEAAARGQVADIEWDTQNVKNAQTSWKDEYWTVVISIPLIMCFIPDAAPYVVAGFEALEKTPDWYQVAVGIAIAAAFGVKKFANYQMKKDGTK